MSSSSTATTQLISLGEKLFMIQGVAQNLRNDGRSRSSYRYFTIETDIIPSSNGSCRLYLNNTQILVGVHASLDVPDYDTPDQGKLNVYVECNIPDMERSASQTLSAELTNELQSIMCDNESLDLQELCLAKGKKCWTIYVDVSILSNDGNLLDAITMATRAALLTTTIPVLQVSEIVDDDDDVGDNTSSSSNDPKHKHNSKVNIALTDAFAVKPIFAENVPITVTLTKIGDYFVVDASEEETACSSCQLSVCISPNLPTPTQTQTQTQTQSNDKNKYICSIRKNGAGSLSIESVKSMIQVAKPIGLDLIKEINQLISKKNSQEDNDDDVMHE